MKCLVLLVVVGCASAPIVGGQTAYQPISQNGNYGYSETQLNARTYEIHFAAVSQGDASQGAMMRAAEVTLGSRFDGFVVASRVDGSETRVRRRFVVGRVRRNVPTVVLTINMLTTAELTAVPVGTIGYDARTIMRPMAHAARQ